MGPNYHNSTDAITYVIRNIPIYPIYKPQKPFPKWQSPEPDKIAASRSNRPNVLPKAITTVKQFQCTIGNISRR